MISIGGSGPTDREYLPLYCELLSGVGSVVCASSELDKLSLTSSLFDDRVAIFLVWMINPIFFDFELLMRWEAAGTMPSEEDKFVPIWSIWNR